MKGLQPAGRAGGDWFKTRKLCVEIAQEGICIGRVHVRVYADLLLLTDLRGWSCGGIDG